MKDGEIQAWSPLEEVVALLAQGMINSVCGRYPSGVARAIERDWLCRETVMRGESMPKALGDLSDEYDRAGFEDYYMLAEFLLASRRLAAEIAFYDVIRDEEFDDLVSSLQGLTVPEPIAEKSRLERARRDVSQPSRP